jgi:tol-pal system protein YbgF
MKYRIVSTMTGTAVLAAALVAAAPAFAQRASLADRVAALEQQAANNQGNVDLLNQITQLRSDQQALRSQIEDLQQQVEQLKSTNRSQYLDLDGRLNRLEGGAPASPGQPALDPNSVPAAPVPSTPSQPAVAAPTAPAAPAPADSAPTIHGDAGAIANRADERGAYEAAFNALKGGQYVDSAQLFQSFLQSYPNGAYAPNALYWLGESYYVTQNYALAQQQFQALLDRYPTHDKAPGALLKVGLSQYGQKQYDAAEKTLSDVSARFPGTDAARTAEDRLRAIQLSQVK